MESEFNSDSLEDDVQEHEIVLGASGRFVFAKKRIYGRMHFLKLPSEEYKNDLVTIESLRKEFAIGYSLDHPNIAKYHRFENNTLYEEYIDGKSLRELIDGNDSRLSDRRFLQSLCLQFLDALRYLRDMGVVHNDIKPENVVITRIGNTLKLIDFNCAQSSDNDLLGGFTAPYKSPEQVLGISDSTSDLYQVGKVMEELCARVGYNKRWARFIAGTTTGNPEKRISLEDAAKLIPGEPRTKRLFWSTLPLIILGVICVFILIPKHTGTEAELEKNSVKDTVVIENITQPSVEITEKREERAVDIKKVIDKKILDYTDRYYTMKLYPICREALENENRGLSEEEELELQKAIEGAYRAVRDYGSRLSSEYPEERNYIEKECLNSMEMKISALQLRLYPPAGARVFPAGK